MDVPMSVELGPGLITSIYDGIQRPLDDIMKVTGGNSLKRGVEVPSLKRDKKWEFVPVAKVETKLRAETCSELFRRPLSYSRRSWYLRM